VFEELERTPGFAQKKKPRDDTDTQAQALFVAGDIRLPWGGIESRRLALGAGNEFEAREVSFLWPALTRAAPADSRPPNQRAATGALSAQSRKITAWAENCPENLRTRSASEAEDSGLNGPARWMPKADTRTPLLLRRACTASSRNVGLHELPPGFTWRVD